MSREVRFLSFFFFFVVVFLFWLLVCFFFVWFVGLCVGWLVST